MCESSNNVKAKIQFSLLNFTLIVKLVLKV